MPKITHKILRFPRVPFKKIKVGSHHQDDAEEQNVIGFLNEKRFDCKCCTFVFFQEVFKLESDLLLSKKPYLIPRFAIVTWPLAVSRTYSLRSVSLSRLFKTFLKTPLFDWIQLK